MIEWISTWRVGYTRNSKLSRASVLIFKAVRGGNLTVAKNMEGFFLSSILGGSKVNKSV